jgi:DNA-binding beta-propeller fold protein YncE
LDPATLKELARLPVGRFPDGLAYAPSPGAIFISDENGGAEIVVDAHTDKKVDSIPLGGGVGNSQFDPAAKQIVVAVGDKDELALIDPVRNHVTDRIKVKKGSHPHGVYVEPAAHLAFVAGEDDASLVVVDLDSKKAAAEFNVGTEPDVLAFDPELKRLYIASESGVVSIFKEVGRGLVKIEDGYIDPAAHTVAVDPKTHQVFFPLKDVNGSPVLRIMAPADDQNASRNPG